MRGENSLSLYELAISLAKNLDHKIIVDPEYKELKEALRILEKIGYEPKYIEVKGSKKLKPTEVSIPKGVKEFLEEHPSIALKILSKNISALKYLIDEDVRRFLYYNIEAVLDEIEEAYKILQAFGVKAEEIVDRAGKEAAIKLRREIEEKERYINKRPDLARRFKRDVIEILNAMKPLSEEAIKNFLSVADERDIEEIDERRFVEIIRIAGKDHRKKLERRAMRLLEEGNVDIAVIILRESLDGYKKAIEVFSKRFDELEVYLEDFLGIYNEEIKRTLLRGIASESLALALYEKDLVDTKTVRLYASRIYPKLSEEKKEKLIREVFSTGFDEDLFVYLITNDERGFREAMRIIGKKAISRFVSPRFDNLYRGEIADLVLNIFLKGLREGDKKHRERLEELREILEEYGAKRELVELSRELEGVLLCLSKGKCEKVASKHIYERIKKNKEALKRLRTSLAELLEQYYRRSRRDRI